MTPLRIFFDWAQVVFALIVLVDTYLKISKMTREYHNLRGFEKELLSQREEQNYSPKIFLITRSFVVLLFLVLQVEWSLDSQSKTLSLGHDFSWFLTGILICYLWWVGNKIQMLVWKSQTVFREKEPPCGVEDCPVDANRKNTLTGIFGDKFTFEVIAREEEK